jgi:hypothetical protein
MAPLLPFTVDPIFVAFALPLAAGLISAAPLHLRPLAAGAISVTSAPPPSLFSLTPRSLFSLLSPSFLRPSRALLDQTGLQAAFVIIMWGH